MSSVQLRSASVVSAFEADEAQRLETAGVSPLPYQAPASEAREGYSAEPIQARSTAPIPRVTIQAFCESNDVLRVIQASAKDRLMARASLEAHAGGIKAAVEYCRQNPIPNLIILESRERTETILVELEGLADLCEPGTKVLVIGHSNDIFFYRELMRRGVSEYVVAPIDVVSLVASISGVYRDTASGKLGQIYAFVGAKGGVGSSTIAHNVGWMMARRFGSDVVLADLDLPFGTASLDFNIDAVQGIAEAIQDSGRLDEVLLDRLLTKCDDHFSLLAAPAKLDRSYDLDANTFGTLLEIAQANVPYTILDIPHVWTSWARNALIAADEIVITASPDLANLRNAKNLIGFLKQARPHDAPPKLVLNQVGLTKRPEIKPSEFARALEIEPLASIPFDAQLFGAAANNGKMIADVSAKSPIAQAFAEVASGVAGRKEQKVVRKSLLDFGALLARKKQVS